MFEQDKELETITKQLKKDNRFRARNIVWPGCVLLSLDGKFTPAFCERILCSIAYIKVVRSFIDPKTKRTFDIWGFQNANGVYCNVLAVLNNWQSIELQRAFYNLDTHSTISFPPYTKNDETILKRIFKSAKCALKNDDFANQGDFSNILAHPCAYWTKK